MCIKNRAESLLCSPEIVTTLACCIPIQNKKLFFYKSHNENNVNLQDHKKLRVLFLVFQAGCYKVPCTRRLKTTEIFFPTVLEASPKSSCWQGHAPFETYGKKSFLASVSLWCSYPLFCGLQADWLPIPLSPCGPLCLSSYKDTSHLGLRTRP